MASNDVEHTDMAYAEKRGGSLTGKWLGEHHSKAHGRFKRAFDTKKAADAYEAYVALMGSEPPSMQDGKAAAPRGRSFRDVAEQCKEAGGPRGVWHNGRDRSTLQRLEFCIDALGTYSIDDITRSLVRDKITERLRKRPKRAKEGTRLKQATLNRYASAVSAVLRWACNEDIIQHKPTLEFRVEQDKVERAVLSFEAEDLVCAWLVDRGLRSLATCVRFLVESGMRLGELYKLTPEQVKNDHIDLKKEQTKTNRPRQVYVRPAMCREIRALVAASTLPDQTQLRRKFYEAVGAAGSESHVVLHGLRHTRATRLMQAKVRREVCMYILGHKDNDVHAGYVHVTLDDQREAAEMVEQMRGEMAGKVVHLPSRNADEMGTSEATG